MRVGFPFELIEPIGEGGFATVYRGAFHDREAAFKFVPVDLNGYKYKRSSVGIYEYDQQEKINKITKFNSFLYFLLIERKVQEKQTILEHTSGQAICLSVCWNSKLFNPLADEIADSPRWKLLTC